MFKKLKDKITEEVAKAPLRLPASVQHQLSQYSGFNRDSQTPDGCSEVDIQISGSLKGFNPTVGSIQTLVDIDEEPTPQFSIGESDSRSATPSNNREDQFHAVSLNEPKRENVTSTPEPSGQRLSRRSSLSSLFNDVSFLPGGDLSYHPYQFQSDLESNVSEFDDSASTSGQSVSDRISKEHIFNAYQKMRTRYHKYKGRYADLAKHYKELEREREKVKNVLADFQDRSLRRISELKEQCTLEQQAKAHLEENLRSDLEEKDNMIIVLQTKVKLLAGGSSSSTSEGVLVDFSSSDSSNKNQDDSGKDQTDLSQGGTQDGEVQLLKEKIQRFETLLNKCMEKIKTSKERIGQLETENDTLKHNEASKEDELDKLQKTHRDQLSSLTESLNLARQEIETLRQQEQEAALASAETKQKVHEELLKQAEEMIRMRAEREQSNNKVALMEAEVLTVKEEMNKQLQESEAALELEKQKLLKELSRGKTEALKLMDEDMAQRLQDVSREKDTHWEGVLQKKLNEEVENHSRLLRQAEEQYRQRLEELQEEKTLALEEKELHCTSLITKEQNNQHKLQNEIAELKREVEAKEKSIEKVREEGLDERRSWVQQIEDIRIRHMDKLTTVNQQHQQFVCKLEVEHKDSIEIAIMQLKEEHRQAIDKIQQQHEELLQAANEDMESSAKSQIDQLRTILRERESELTEKGNSLKEILEQLNQAREQTKMLDSVSQELESLKETNQLSTTRIQQLQEELKLLQHNILIEQSNAEELQKQMEEKSADVDRKQQLIDQLQASLLQKNVELESLASVEAQLATLTESLERKEATIRNLQEQVQSTNEDLNAKEVEWKQNHEHLSSQLKNTEAEFEAAKTTIVTQSEQINNLEHIQAMLSAGESELKTVSEDKERQLTSKVVELEELRQLLCLKDQQIVTLQEEIDRSGSQLSSITSGLEQKNQELSRLLDATQSELVEANKSAQTVLGIKDERILVLEGKESALLSIVQEKEQLLTTQLSNLAAAQDLLSVKEKALTELKEEIEHSNQQFNTVTLEWKIKADTLSEELSQTKAERDSVKSSIASKDEQISLLEKELDQSRQLCNANESELKNIAEDREKSLVVKQQELEVAQDSLAKREQVIASLQGELEQYKRDLDALSAESELKRQELIILQRSQSDLNELQSLLSSKDERIVQLEEEVTKTQNLSSLAEERERLLMGKELELETLKQSFGINEERVAELQENLDQLLKTVESTTSHLTAKQSETESLQQVINGLQADLSKSTIEAQEAIQRGGAMEVELEELRHAIKEKESRVIALQGDIGGMAQHLALKDNELMELHQSLVLKESIILDLQNEVERTGRMLSDSKSNEEQRQQQLSIHETEMQTLMQSLAETNNEKERLATVVAKLKDKLSSQSEEVEKIQKENQIKLKEIEINHQLQIAKLEEILKTAQATAQLNLAEKEEILRNSNDRAGQLETELKASLSRLEEEVAEKDRLTAECNQLKSDLEAQVSSSDQIKALTDEVNKLVEDKSRLESLCKRFKVQLADTKKMMSANKSATDANVPKADGSEADQLNNSNQQNEVIHQQENGQQDLLQQQLTMLQKELEACRHQYKMEVTELRRLVEMGQAPARSNGSNSNFHGSLEEATELEYLRNILFEYMMGNQPATLAKVVAAIVKFTPEQTRKITEREVQRSAGSGLLGHLGFV